MSGSAVASGVAVGADSTEAVGAGDSVAMGAGVTVGAGVSISVGAGVTATVGDGTSVATGAGVAAVVGAGVAGAVGAGAVSYTHLDVYKRQKQVKLASIRGLIRHSGFAAVKPLQAGVAVGYGTLLHRI